MFRIFIVCLTLIANYAYADNSFKAIDVGNEQQLRIKVPLRCMLGDFDAITHEMMYSKSPKLLLSISGLNGKNEVAQEILGELHSFPFPNAKSEEEIKSNHEYLEKFSAHFYAEGYDVAIVIPAKEKIIEIRICKDSENTNSCLKKKVQDISKILESYIKPEANYFAEDAVYYYQPIFRSSKSFYCLDEIYEAKNINKYLAELKNIDPELTEEVRPSLQELAILQSSPLYLEINKKDRKKNRLTISLPMYSKVKCSMEAN